MSEAAVHTHCPILHQDRFIIVVNKPAGVLSHPNSAKIDPKIRCAFEGRYDLDEKCFDSPAGKVWLIHRLDQDTSGVLLAALDERTAEKCRALFEADAVKKHYLAIVRGHPPAKDTWLDHLSISRGAGRVRTTVLKGRPANAELHYQLLGHHTEQRLSLIDIALITGRTHQIRVQAASRQHPLAGDDVYGDFDMNRRLRQQLGLKRLALHARQLTFKHPASGYSTTLVAPLPPDLAAVAETLGFTVG
ncbi:MAG: RluA family pseudouridine synthase [Verrucomicrobia bacterium]|nr:RluA family pseudouridine synthase [Verrucomicrobiota bacterium]